MPAPALMQFVDHRALLAAAEQVRLDVAPAPHTAPPGAARADFVCSNCTKRSGAEVQWTNLPAESLRCPRCGHKRGFRRLFNAVAVSTVGHRAAQIIDPAMTHAFDQHAAVKSGAAAAARAGIVGRGIPAAAALSSIDPAARRDSSQVLVPMVRDAAGILGGRLNVRPRWVTSRG